MSKHAASSGVRRGLLLFVVIAAWLAIAGVGGLTLGKLSQVTSNDQTTFLPRSAESVKAQAALEKFTDAGVLPVFVVVEEPQAYADLTASSTSGGSAGPPGAAYAAQIADSIDIAGEPLTSWLAPGQPPVAIGADDESGVLLVYGLDSGKTSEQDADGEDQLATVIADLRANAGEATSADEVYVGGPAGFAADTSESFAGIDGVLLLVTLGVVLLILLVVYRSLALPILVLFSAVCGLALAGLAVYLLADNDVLVLNGQSQGILSILVIGAATDYSLLIVARYREELERHESRFDAMRRAWRTCVEPIAASAGTVIAGLLCLLLSDLNSNRGLGPVGAIGIVAAFLVSLTLLPALLLLGRWVFWPRVPVVRQSATDADADAAEGPRGIWARVASLVERRPRKVWVSVAIVLLALCAFVPTFRASGTTDSEIFLNDLESVTAQEVIDDHYDAGAADPIRIVAAADDASAAAKAIADIDGVASAVAGTDEVDGNVVIDVVPANGTSADSLVDDVREIAHEAAPGSLVGGDAAVKIDTIATAETDLQVIIPVVLVVVLLVLIALLRSIIAPLLLVAATVVSFGSAIGVAALVFNHVLGFPGADPTVPLLGFVFLVALGVDYSIFLMTRAREEVAHHGPVDGVTRALRVTGGVITSAGIVLAATFAALSVIPLLFLAQIAFIVAFGVLLDTLVVRSLLVPALAIDLGRRTWWPSKLSSRGRH